MISLETKLIIQCVGYHFIILKRRIWYWVKTNLQVEPYVLFYVYVFCLYLIIVRRYQLPHWSMYSTQWLHDLLWKYAVVHGRPSFHISEISPWRKLLITLAAVVDETCMRERLSLAESQAQRVHACTIIVCHQRWRSMTSRAIRLYSGVPPVPDVNTQSLPTIRQVFIVHRTCDGRNLL